MIKSEVYTYEPGTIVSGFIRPPAPKDHLVRSTTKKLSEALFAQAPFNDGDYPINGVGIGDLHFERHDLDPMRIQPQEIITILTQDNPNNWLDTIRGEEVLDTIVDSTKPLDRKFDIVVFHHVGMIRAGLA